MMLVMMFLALAEAGGRQLVVAEVLWRFHCKPWALVTIKRRHNMHGKGLLCD